MTIPLGQLGNVQQSLLEPMTPEQKKRAIARLDQWANAFTLEHELSFTTLIYLVLNFNNVR